MTLMEFLWALASCLLQAVLIVIGLSALYLYGSTKAEGISWRCHFGIHDWERRGYKRQCRRCGCRRNDLIGFKRFKMGFEQLRTSLKKVKKSNG